MAEKDRLPVDRGWAWMVLAGCAIETFIIFGTIKSFGLLFNAFKEEYDASAATISLVISVKTIVFSLTCPVVMGVGLLYLSPRILIMAGSLLHCLAYLISGFAPNVDMLFLTLGVFWGMSEGLVHGPVLLTLGKYFNKRKGLANTLANTGSSLGGICLSPLYGFLLNKFTLQGALLIISGVNLHLLETCCLLRPPSFYMRKSSNITELTRISSKHVPDDETGESEGRVDAQNINDHVEESAMLCEKMDDDEHRNSLIMSDICKTEGAQCDSEDPTEEQTYLPINEDGISSKQLYKEMLTHKETSSSEVARSLSDIKEDGMFKALSVSSLAVIDKLENTDKVKLQDRSFHDILKQTFTNLIDKELFKNKLFLLFSLTTFLGVFGCGMLLTFIPPYAEDLKIDKSKISLLVTISSVLDLAGRICVALIADSRIIKRHHIISIAFIIVGIACHLSKFFVEFWSLAVFSAIYGFFGGMYFCLFPVILVDFVGMEKLSVALGLNLLMHGASYAIAVPVLGVIRDVTGSYVGSFHLFGACQILAGLTLLLVPVARR